MFLSLSESHMGIFERTPAVPWMLDIQFLKRQFSVFVHIFSYSTIGSFLV